MEDVEQQIKTELDLYDERQTELQKLEQELQADPKFARFLEARQQFADLDARVWARVEEVMIANNVRQIKTDKVTLTIAERTNFDIDMDQLPGKYIKKVPNTTLIGSEFKLTGKPVKGTTPSKKLYLTKRFKKEA